MDYKIKQPMVIDVSHWEGRIQWDKVMAGTTPPAGVICKATEGTGWVDDTFEWNRSFLKDLGIPSGSYHFYRFEYDPLKQAEHFLRVIERNNGYGELYPVLDIEWGDYKDRKNKWVRSPRGKSLTDALQVWLDKVELETGAVPMIYTSQSYVSKYMCDWFGANTLKNPSRYPLWVAWYPYSPDDFNSPAKIPKGWTIEHLWQYAEDGIIDGIRNDGVDLNKPSALFGLPGVNTPPPDNPYNLPRDVKVTATIGLNIRTGPSTSFAKVGKLHKGDIVTIEETVNEGSNLWGKFAEGQYIAIVHSGNVYAEWK